MSDVFGKIASTLGGAVKSNPLAAIGTGISGVTSFLKNRQQSDYLKKQLDYQKFLSGLSTDPAKMSAYISGFEKPLSAGLTKGVENEVQAFGAERGLSTSPQIMEQILAQALGPYQIQEQQHAIETAMRSLGLPFSSAPHSIPGSGPMDISALIKQLMGGGGTPSPRTVNTGGGSALPGDSPDMAPPEIPGIWPGFLSDSGGNIGDIDPSIFGEG
jgi:hypothetical protein